MAVEAKKKFKYMLVSGGADSVASLRTYLEQDPTNAEGLTCIYYEMTDTLRSEAEFEAVSMLACRYPQVTFFS